MATAVAAAHTAVVKRPSIKKYKAPTPPRRTETTGDDPDTDSQNNLVDREVNDNDSASDCIQTKGEPIKLEERPASNRNSPVARRPPLAPKLNGHDGETGSVLTRAAIFENGSPFQRDPITMSIRERKALFEKNKGAAIVPKAPFGQAPMAKLLQGGNKALSRPVKPLTASAAINSTNSPTTLTKSTDSLHQTKEGGIKGKLNALLNKEQTISEAAISQRNKKERQLELEMLQNRFNYKAKTPSNDGSDSEPEATDPSERAPLMGSTVSLHPARRLEPEARRTSLNKCRSESVLSSPSKDEPDDVVGSQPAKRRSSQDSPVVLSVLDDVKRIKMASANGAPPAGLYPHLSDIETATSNTDESSCGGSTENVASERPNALNNSENWADTSFGRDIMQSMKKKPAKPTVSFGLDVSADDRSLDDDELDDVIDEALAEVETPRHKATDSLSSKSFTYRMGSPHRGTPAQQCEFKSPLKTPASVVRSARSDSKDQLVHSVSFYRRMQSATAHPQTPVRSVRHTGEETQNEGAVERQPVCTLRERIAELQAEICKQQTIISQASQALNLCASTVEFSSSIEQAEGERLLLLATRRRSACLHEVQRLQVEGPGPAAERGAVSLTLSRLSLPLRRDYVRQLNADGAVGHHCVCLLQCRDRVIATSMQLTRATSGVLTFPDHIEMQGLDGDFKVTVEVYLMQASKELLPHDVKYHINSKKQSCRLLTPKSKASELKTPRVQSPAGPASVRSPRLQPHGYCIFALQQVDRTSFTLNKVPHGSPLDGNITLQMKAKLSLPPPAPHAAFLTAFDDVSGLGAWHRRWCVLRVPRLSWWKYPDDVQKKTPMGDLDLGEVVSERAVRAPRDLCARANTLLLESAAPHDVAAAAARGSLVYSTRDDGTVVRRHLLAADTQEDRDAWLDVLNRALDYVRCNSQED